MQTLSRYFTFQVLNVFLVTTIAGFAVEVRAVVLQLLLTILALLGRLPRCWLSLILLECDCVVPTTPKAADEEEAHCAHTSHNVSSVHGRAVLLAHV